MDDSEAIKTPNLRINKEQKVLNEAQEFIDKYKQLGTPKLLQLANQIISNSNISEKVLLVSIDPAELSTQIATKMLEFERMRRKAEVGRVTTLSTEMGKMKLFYGLSTEAIDLFNGVS